MLDRIKAYITERLQCVNIADSYSDTAAFKWGVPQRSKFDPLLFLFHINGMHNCIELNMVHFADDSTGHVIGDTL